MSSAAIPQGLPGSNVEQRVLHEGAYQDKGEMARMASITGAIAVADLVKTTLGPKGMDKILQSVSQREQGVSVTNDGATILKAIWIDNPAAKVLVDMSKTQDDEVGDGTTSVTVLAGQLLKEAESLFDQRIHPMIIIDGWRLALAEARKALEESSVDNSEDPKKFREDLLNLAKTTLSSKVLNQEKNYFAELAVDAVLRLKGSGNLEAIQFIKKSGGSLKDSYLEEGFILDKKIGVGQPKRMENAKILIANTPMDTDKVKIYGSRVKVDSMSKVADIEQAEQKKMETKCNKIIDHGCNVFINRQLIYNYPEQLFANKGMMAIEHADFDGIERLALVTGGEIVSTFDAPNQVTLGECKLIEEIMIGEDKLLRFSGVKAGEACTVVLRGPSSHFLDEADRSLHDALCVLTQTVKETRTTLGGGCAEMLMAEKVEQLAKKTGGKKSIAMEAFARALRSLPGIIAENGGYDASELVTQLRAEHAKGNNEMGLDMYNGCVANVRDLGIVESFKVKSQVVISAAEAAEMILRVDDIIKCAPRQQQQ